MLCQIHQDVSIAKRNRRVERSAGSWKEPVHLTKVVEWPRSQRGPERRGRGDRDEAVVWPFDFVEHFMESAERYAHVLAFGHSRHAEAGDPGRLGVASVEGSRGASGYVEKAVVIDFELAQ